MIPRVHISPHASKRRGHELSAFARGPYERPLRILIDVDSFGATDDVAALLGFSENPNLQLDPVKLSQIMFHDDGNAVLDWSKPRSVSRHAIRSAARNIQVIQEWGEPLDLAKDPMLKERLALAMYAERNRCDAFVTSSRQLLSVAQRFYPCGNPVDLAAPRANVT